MRLVKLHDIADPLPTGWREILINPSCIRYVATDGSGNSTVLCLSGDVYLHVIEPVEVVLAAIQAAEVASLMALADHLRTEIQRDSQGSDYLTS